MQQVCRHKMGSRWGEPTRSEAVLHASTALKAARQRVPSVSGTPTVPGFESDRQRLMAYDRAAKTSRELLPGWDRNADVYAFSPKGDAMAFGWTRSAR